MAKKAAKEQVAWQEWDCSWLSMLEAPKPDDCAQVRLNIANVIRHCKRLNGEPLHDLSICRRVKGATPSLVAAVRKELEENGTLACEQALAEKKRRG